MPYEYAWLAETPVLMMGNAAEQRIVDNSDTANVTAVGTWATATAGAGYIGANYRSHVAATTADSFTWKLSPASSQRYRLYARHPSAATYSTTASYSISHAGGTATVVLNQQSSGGQWRELGTYTFSPAAGHNVKLATQANGIVVADAVKIVPVDQPASVFFIHADQIDTPRIVQDAQYNNRWAWDPDGFGQLPPNENPAGLGSFTFNLRMPGQYFDAELGLFYNHFRDYDPQTGRYIESDPIGLAGGHGTYSYSLNQPTRFADPRGQVAIADDAVVWAVIGIGAILMSPPGQRAIKTAANVISELCKADDKDECLREIEECMRICTRARKDPNQRNVWGGSWWRCLTGCVSFRCQDYIDETRHADPERK